MMQEWEKYVQEVQVPADVVQIRNAAS